MLAMEPHRQQQRPPVAVDGGRVEAPAAHGAPRAGACATARVLRGREAELHMVCACARAALALGRASLARRTSSL